MITEYRYLALYCGAWQSCYFYTSSTCKLHTFKADYFEKQLYACIL